MSSAVTEVGHSLKRLRLTFEDLALGGLRAQGPQRLAELRHLREDLLALGAQHLGQRLGQLIEAVENSDPKASEALMRAQASVQTFERILTLEWAQETVQAWNEDEV